MYSSEAPLVLSFVPPRAPGFLRGAGSGIARQSLRQASCGVSGKARGSASVGGGPATGAWVVALATFRPMATGSLPEGSVGRCAASAWFLVGYLGRLLAERLVAMAQSYGGGACSTSAGADSMAPLQVLGMPWILGPRFEI